MLIVVIQIGLNITEHTIIIIISPAVQQMSLFFTRTDFGL